MAKQLVDERGQIDLLAVLRRLWDGRWWIAISVATVTGAFIVLAYNMRPVYQVKVVLAPAANDRAGLAGSLGSSMGSLGGLAALAGINIGTGNSATEEALAVMRSREFTGKFITDLNLMPKLFENSWDPATRQWKGLAAQHPTLAQACRYFDHNIRKADFDRRTGLVTLTVEWVNPSEAALWANELVARLNSEMRARAMEQSNAAVTYLEKELSTTSTIETRMAISRLMESQVNQRMFASVSREFAFRTVDRAMPPDLKERIRPNRPLLAVIGMMLGFLLGAAVVLIRHSLRAQPAPASN